MWKKDARYLCQYWERKKLDWYISRGAFPPESSLSKSPFKGKMWFAFPLQGQSPGRLSKYVHLRIRSAMVGHFLHDYTNSSSVHRLWNLLGCSFLIFMATKQNKTTPVCRILKNAGCIKSCMALDQIHNILVEGPVPIVPGPLETSYLQPGTFLGVELQP